MQHQHYWIKTRDTRAAAGDPNADQALCEDEQCAWNQLWRCALDLCHRAGDPLEEADITDDRTRQGFPAAIRHQNTVPPTAVRLFGAGC